MRWLFSYELAQKPISISCVLHTCFSCDVTFSLSYRMKIYCFLQNYLLHNTLYYSDWLRLLIRFLFDHYCFNHVALPSMVPTPLTFGRSVHIQSGKTNFDLNYEYAIIEKIRAYSQHLSILLYLTLSARNLGSRIRWFILGTDPITYSQYQNWLFNLDFLIPQINNPLLDSKICSLSVFFLLQNCWSGMETSLPSGYMRPGPD